MAELTVMLTKEEVKGLGKIVREDLRTPDLALRWLLREEMARRGLTDKIRLTVEIEQGSEAIPHVMELLAYIQQDPDLAEKMLDMAASEGVIEVPGHADAVRYVGEKYGTKRD